MNIIETQDLTKTYGDFTAVSHLNLHIRKGSVYGFLGPNGAGKTTVMKMLINLCKTKTGEIELFGIIHIYLGNPMDTCYFDLSLI